VMWRRTIVVLQAHSMRYSLTPKVGHVENTECLSCHLARWPHCCAAGRRQLLLVGFGVQHGHALLLLSSQQGWSPCSSS
jgi:hypothetical protein